jgi:hypothetical protein
MELETMLSALFIAFILLIVVDAGIQRDDLEHK